MDLRAQLTEIYKERGTLTAEVVLQEAKDPGHPLHPRFEWDDTVAGHKYRLQQARDLIRVVRITEFKGEAEVTRVRAFVSVPAEDGPSYRPAEEIRDDPFARKLVMQQMERDWKALLRRWREHSEFFEMVRKDLAS